ncbi:DUF4270 family protein [Spongiimicrobium sp. 2-473A-2-J]|uniref:DUF4270 family protein n=1 Tax=Eudoraea algarum TaxID=3417568 RepID=UPI003D36371F
MKKLLGITAVLGLILACSVDPQDIPTLEVGQEFADSNVRLLVLDTFAVELSTFKFDSIISSDGDRLLIGRYSDAFLGSVTAAAYMELSAQTYSLPNDAELDSIALILGYDDYFYSDTTQVTQIRVHLLTEELRPEEDFFYNTSTLPFDSVPLAQRNYRPEPFDEDSLHISLPISAGQEIFDLIQENDINDTDDLREKFKGFSLQSGVEDNGAIVGFSKNQEQTYLRFFYSVPDEFEDVEGSFDLFINPFSETPSAFNNITSDVSGTTLEVLTDQETNLPTTASNNLSYIQSGIGYATRVEFPTIKRVFDLQGTGTVLSAILQLKPPVASYDDILPLRDSLNVAILDQNNEIIGPVANGQGIVLGRISQENEEFSNVIYEIPVGVYIDAKLTETPTVEDALVLFPPEFNGTVDRIVLEGPENTDFEARLILTYAIYDD